jgi:hypothetical protein
MSATATVGRLEETSPKAKARPATSSSKLIGGGLSKSRYALLHALWRPGEMAIRQPQVVICPVDRNDLCRGFPESFGRRQPSESCTDNNNPA